MPDDRPPPWSAEETTDARTADERNLYKVEQWSGDGLHVEGLIWAGSSLDKARAEFNAAIGHRPAIVATIRQRIRIIAKWPQPWPGE